jgi:Rod binding domain-containing protein
MATVTPNSTVPAAGKASAHDALVRQTQKWVGMTFYGTLLKQVRNEPFRSDVLDGGQGGKMFGSMLDQQLSTHMSRGKGDKLVNAIVDRIEKKSSVAQRSAAAAYGAQTKIAPAAARSGFSPDLSSEPAEPAGDSALPQGKPANNVRIYVDPGFGT